VRQITYKAIAECCDELIDWLALLFTASEWAAPARSGSAHIWRDHRDLAWAAVPVLRLLNSRRGLSDDPGRKQT
jgi:hypothetical protein